MGNITCKFSGCSKKKSLQCHETSKILHPRLANKERTSLDLEKQETATNKEEEGDLEKQETTRNKKNEKKISVPVSQPIFPPEIIIEILSWLPVESLLRLQLVCKQWYAEIQDRHLIEKNMSRATQVTYRYNVMLRTPTAYESFQLICGCDGLLLQKSNATHKYHIQNPATSQILELPDPHKGSFGITLSFNPSSSNYKLVSIYDDEAESSNECCEILTVGSENSWRPLKIPNLKDVDKKRELISVLSAGAAVHCIRIIKIGSNISEEVVSLDLGTECFTITALPKGLFLDWKKVWALDWNGKLAFADRVIEDLCVWVLEDYKKHKWGVRMITVPLAFMKKTEDMEGDLIPLFAQCGNLWFWLKGKKIFSYNIKTGCIGHTIAVPQGYAVSQGFYCCPPSLITFKGMQPEKKKPNQQSSNQV